MKRKGEITVFLSLLLLIVIGLIYAVIRSAEVVMIKAKVDSISHISIDSVFSEYNKELYEKYGLLYVDTSYNGAADGGDEYFLLNLKEYVEANSVLSSNISYLSSDASIISHASDDDYKSVKKQISKDHVSTISNEELDEYINQHEKLYRYVYEDYEMTLEEYLENTDIDEKFHDLIALIEEDMRMNNPYFSFENLIDSAHITVGMQDKYGKVYECSLSYSLNE